MYTLAHSTRHGNGQQVKASLLVCMFLLLTTAAPLSAANPVVYVSGNDITYDYFAEPGAFSESQDVPDPTSDSTIDVGLHSSDCWTYAEEPWHYGTGWFGSGYYYWFSYDASNPVCAYSGSWGGKLEYTCEGGGGGQEPYFSLSAGGEGAYELKIIPDPDRDPPVLGVDESLELEANVVDSSSSNQQPVAADWTVNSNDLGNSETITLLDDMPASAQGPGTYTATAEYDCPQGSEVLSDTLSDIRFARVDLDVDSNNDGTIEVDNDDEDSIEEDSPGKLIAVNDNDSDGDGTEDCEDNDWDNDGDELAEMKLRLDPDNLPYAHKVKLSVSDSDVSKVRIFDDSNDAIIHPSTSSSGSSSSEWEKELNEIDLPNNDLTFHVEGVEPGQVTLTLTYTDDEGEAIHSDKVTGTVYKTEFLVKQNNEAPEVMGYVPQSSPNPIVKLQALENGDVTINDDGTVSVTARGTVKDPIADICKNSSADIESVHFFVNGDETGGDTELTRDPAYEQANSSLFRPYAYRSEVFEKTLTFEPHIGYNRIYVKTSENKLGNQGYSAINLYVEGYYEGEPDPEKKSPGTFKKRIDWEKTYREPGNPPGKIYRTVIRINAGGVDISGQTFYVDGKKYKAKKKEGEYYLGRSPIDVFVFCEEKPEFNLQGDAKIQVMPSTLEGWSGQQAKLTLSPAKVKPGEEVVVNFALPAADLPGFPKGTTFSIEDLTVTDVQVVDGVLKGKVQAPDNESVCGWKDVRITVSEEKKQKIEDLFLVVRPARTVLLGKENKYTINGTEAVKVFVPSKYGGKVICKFSKDKARLAAVQYKPEDGDDWEEKTVRNDAFHKIPPGTAPGWYRLKIAAPEKCKFFVRHFAHPKIPDPENPDQEWEPWNLSWYPMAMELGNNHLYDYDTNKGLVKYDLAVGHMTEAEFEAYKNGDAPLPLGAYRRQAVSYYADGDYDTDYKDGEQMQKKILREKNAEETAGWDFNNADDDDNPWTGWENNVEYDFLNDDGECDDTDDAGEWFGHCHAQSAILALYDSPPQKSTTYKGDGIEETFTVKDKKDLLIAAFSQSDIVDEKKKYGTPPGQWHALVAKSFHQNSKNSEDPERVVADVHYDDDDDKYPIWNHCIYRFGYVLSQKDPENLKKVKVLTRIVAYKKEGYQYKYEIEFDDAGKPLDGGEWYEERYEGQDKQNRRPDNCWRPKRPRWADVSKNQFWRGTLSLKNIDAIIEEMKIKE